MKDLFFSLLKKEFFELIQNKKFLVFAFIVVCVSVVLIFFEKSFSDIVYLMVIMLLVTEYAFDSCYNDIKSGAAFFYLNIKCSTIYIVYAKIIYSVFLAIVIFELYLLFVFQDFSNADLLWFIPTIVFNTGLIYNVSILAKRSDLLTSSIVMSVSFFVIETLFLLSNFFIRFLILIVLSIVTLMFASKLSKTINYRAEISTNR